MLKTREAEIVELQLKLDDIPKGECGPGEVLGDSASNYQSQTVEAQDSAHVLKA